MRLIPHIALAIWLLFLPGTAWARLRGLGAIKTVGLVSENPLDVAIVLEGCEWDGVESSDGGRTWRVVKETPRVFKTPPFAGENRLPSKLLYPLPEEGPIQYRREDRKRDFYSGALFLSEDAGATWIDVSPWRFISEEIVRDVDAEQQRFLFLYGKRLPHDKAWPWAFGATAAAFLAIGGWRCRQLRGYWRKPVISSAIAYVLTGLALFFLHRLLVGGLRTDQWHTRLWYWSPWGGVSYPRWPFGVFGHLTGNVWMAPLMAAAFFPATALCASILFAAPRAGRAVFRTLAVVVSYGGLLILLSVVGSEMGQGRSYRIEEFTMGPPNVSADRGQPNEKQNENYGLE